MTILRSLTLGGAAATVVALMLFNTRFSHRSTDYADGVRTQSINVSFIPSLRYVVFVSLMLVLLTCLV